MKLRHVVIFRRQIDVGKVISRPCEYFVVDGFGMVFLGELQFAVQDRIWKAGRSSLTRDATERGHVVTQANLGGGRHLYMSPSCAPVGALQVSKASSIHESADNQSSATAPSLGRYSEGAIDP